MDIRRAIVQILTQTAKDKGLAHIEWTDEIVLGAEGVGFDSLDMATVVAELDAELEIDPFANGAAPFHTVGQFVALYERELVASRS